MVRGRCRPCRRIQLPLLLAAILGTLLAVPAGLAAQPHQVLADIQVAGTTQFQGSADVRVALGGVTLDADSPIDLAFHLTFNSARVRVLNSPYTYTGKQPQGSAPTSFTGQTPSDEFLNATGAGSINLKTPGEESTYRLLLPKDGGASLSMSLEGPLHCTVTPRADWGSGPHRTPFWVGRNMDAWSPAGTLQRLDGNASTVKGAMFVFLYGGTFDLKLKGQPDQEIQTGERLNASRSVADPSGTYGTWWYDRIVLLIETEDGHAELSSQNNAPVRYAARSISGDFVGDFSFSGVTGRVDVDRQALVPSQHLFQTIGQFDGTADYTNQTSSGWRIAGPATFVGVNGITVAGDRNAHRLATIAFVAGAVGLAAIVAGFLTHAGRELLTFITGRNVARPLESQYRLRFLEHIARQPGLTLKDLAERTGLTKWGAIHHMAILKRAKYVDEVRSGNAFTYMLNSHSYRFYAEALNPATGTDVFVADAVATLGHPKRRLIFDALVSNGPSPYTGMVAAWTQMGIPLPHPTQRDVSHHASKMVKAGLLFRRREGPNVFWAVNVDVERIKQQQRRSFLSDPIATAIVQALSAQPGLDASGIARSLGPSIRRPLERVREKLVLLEQAGIVAASGTGYALSAG